MGTRDGGVSAPQEAETPPKLRSILERQNKACSIRRQQLEGKALSACSIYFLSQNKKVSTANLMVSHPVAYYCLEKDVFLSQIVAKQRFQLYNNGKHKRRGTG